MILLSINTKVNIIFAMYLVIFLVLIGFGVISVLSYRNHPTKIVKPTQFFNRPIQHPKIIRALVSIGSVAIGVFLYFFADIMLNVFG